MKYQNILLIYIEPTPYILGLIENIQHNWPGNIDVLFLSENVSQKWNINLNKNYIVLPKNNMKKIVYIKNILSKNKYACIHLAGWSYLFLIIVLFMAKFKKIPVTIETDTAFHYTKLWKRMIKRTIYPFIFSLVNLFLPGGIRQAKYLEYYGVTSKKILPVQMTVDVLSMRRHANTLNDADRLKIRECHQIPKHNVVFLYVGRLEPHKGIKDLIEAFNQIQYESTLLFVGEGTLQKYIENSLKTNSRIRYSGRLSNHELIEVYFAVDVLVLPSHLEPWGLVINEAMAMNLPVIVSDSVGCIDDLVTHRETGLIFPAKQVTELKNTMEYMIKTPHQRKLMGSHSGEKISDWTLENEAKKMCQAWNQLDIRIPYLNF